MKTQKGITLIALIITIIVMLILVGVSVSIALNSGLFKAAQGGAKNTAAERINETQLSTGWITVINSTTGNPEQVHVDSFGKITPEVTPEVGNYVTYLGQNTWRVTKIEENGQIIISGFGQETNEATEAEFLAKFIDEKYALEADFCSLNDYVLNLTGKQVPEFLGYSGSDEEEVESFEWDEDTYLTTEELNNLNIRGVDFGTPEFCGDENCFDHVIYTVSEINPFESYTAEFPVKWETGPDVQNKVIINVTLSSDVSFASGDGSSSSPWQLAE